MAEHHGIWIKGLHHIGNSELLPNFFFDTVNFKSQISVSIYGPVNLQLLSYRGEKNWFQVKMFRAKPDVCVFCVYVCFFFLELWYLFSCLVNKLKRIDFSTASLLKMAPTAEERNIIHDIFLNTLDTRQEGEGWRRTKVLCKRKVMCLLSKRVVWNKCMHFVFPFHCLNSI